MMRERHPLSLASRMSRVVKVTTRRGGVLAVALGAMVLAQRGEAQPRQPVAHVVATSPSRVPRHQSPSSAAKAVPNVHVQSHSSVLSSDLARSREHAIPSTPAATSVPGRANVLAMTSLHASRAPLVDVSPWYAPALSAVLPGLGQGLLRQQRGVVYLAAEGYLIMRALQAQRDARRERDAYREIASTVARAGFGAERPNGAWEYYERLQNMLESGAYNQTPEGPLTPESDPTTFNGATWLLARETFWRDPDVQPDPTSSEYRLAIEFYERRAAGEAFRWSWRDAQLEQDLFRQTIARSNESSRVARQMVGLLLANHALSLVDAYVSVRLRVFGEGVGPTSRVGMVGQLPLPGRRR